MAKVMLCETRWVRAHRLANDLDLAVRGAITGHPTKAAVEAAMERAALALTEARGDPDGLVPIAEFDLPPQRIAELLLEEQQRSAGAETPASAPRRPWWRRVLAALRRMTCWRS